MTGHHPDRAPGLTLDEAATVLGISREAVRTRVRRGRLPAVRVGREWLVTVPGQPVNLPEQRPVMTGPDRSADHAETLRLRLEVEHAHVLVARADAERDRALTDRDRLAAALERESDRSAQEAGELRRMLHLAQQQIGELVLQLPAPAETVTTAPEPPATPPVDAAVTSEAGRRTRWRFWRR